jgi:hypothetical protein
MLLDTTFPSSVPLDSNARQRILVAKRLSLNTSERHIVHYEAHA